jgi:hypothetical protein
MYIYQQRQHNMIDRDPERLLIKALLTVAFSAGVTAALSKDPWHTVLKNFIAGSAQA